MHVCMWTKPGEQGAKEAPSDGFGTIVPQNAQHPTVGNFLDPQNQALCIFCLHLSNNFSTWGSNQRFIGLIFNAETISGRGSDWLNPNHY